MTQEDYQTHEWKNLKFTIGGIFSNKIALSESGAIEGNPAVHAIAEFVWGQLEEKDKRITELLDNGEATAKLIVQYCATIESLRKEITLKDGIISDHAESILELRKENEELRRFKKGVTVSSSLKDELGGMLTADRKLYEQMLDSPASFHFNNICNLVRTQDDLLDRMAEALADVKLIDSECRAIETSIFSGEFLDKIDSLLTEYNQTKKA